LISCALSSSRTNLGNLEHLATLQSDVSLFKNSTASQGERLKNSLDELNKNMEKSITLLEQIEKKSIFNKPKTFMTSFKGLFKSKS
jgi:flagellar hook-basal body complex protein FliE